MTKTLVLNIERIYEDMNNFMSELPCQDNVRSDRVDDAVETESRNVFFDCYVESGPNGIKPHSPGSKDDAGKTKAGILADFGLALMAVSEVGTFGANKYTRGGWQSVPNGVERYSDAAWRHLLKENQEPLDDESGLRHAAHMAWNALARLELMLRSVDD